MLGDLLGCVVGQAVYQAFLITDLLGVLSGHEALFVVVFVHGGLANLAKAAAAPLHEVHALEEVGEHRVSAQARDALREYVIGNPSAFEHGTWRG